GYQTQRPAQEQFRPRQEEQKGEESVYKDCICLRANGLQDQCPVLDCLGREECVAVNPGPCCKPALSRLCEMQQQKKQRAAAEAAVNYIQN
ncbi:hypothetical protein GN156_29050, partial [bacterium LRH843]|nr:hypothetical protein [bacterium LRH843]